LFTLLDAVPGSPENVLVADHLVGAIVETVQPEFMAGQISNLINYVDIRNRGDDPGVLASDYCLLSIIYCHIPTGLISDYTPLLAHLIELFASVLTSNEPIFGYSIANRLAVPGTYFENEDSRFIALTVDILCTSGNDPSYFESLKGLRKTAITEQLLIAYHYLFLNSIDGCSEAIVHDIPFFLDLVRGGFSSSDSHWPILELVLLITTEASVYLTESQTDVAMSLLEILRIVLDGSIEHVPMPTALTAIIAVLNHCSIAGEIIPSILNPLLCVTQSAVFEFHPLAVEAIGSLASAAKEDIQEFTESIFENVRDVAGIGEKPDSILTSSAILTLGSLFAHAIPSDIGSQAINIIFSVWGLGDIDVQNSVIQAITRLVIRQSRLLFDFQTDISTLIRMAYNSVVSSEDGTSQFDESALSSQQIVLLVNVFKLVKWICKHQWYLLCSDKEDILAILFRFMETPCTDLSVPAISAALHGSIALLRVSAFCERLSPWLQTADDVRVVTVSLKSLVVLMQRGEDPMTLADSVVFFGCNVMNSLVSGQIAREFRRKIAQYFGAFLKESFGTTLVFPLEDICHQVSNFVTCPSLVFVLEEYIMVLAKYCKSRPRLGDEEARMITDCVAAVFVHHLSSFETDALTPFTPVIIAAVKFVLETNLIDFATIGDSPLNFVEFVLTSEDTGTVFFWSTVTSAIASVFDFLRQGIGDFSHWIPLVLSKLPIRARFEEAEEIYSSLCRILLDWGMFELHETILMIIVHSLGLKDNIFRKLDLSEPTRNTMIMIGQRLIDEMHRDLRAFVPDANVLGRFCHRTRLEI
jgi:hypothetical protein